VEFVVDNAAGFLRVLQFPLAIAPHSSPIIIRSWYNRPVVASGIMDWVPLHPTREKANFNQLKL
jgi:hypothetical protein